MIAGGMSWKQAIFTVFLGNVLVLAPMLLNAHAGAKYGIPFPVFARASFGVTGANVPAVLRALVACGWFGINTWIGGEAINAMAVALVPAWKNFAYGVWICFGLFWLLHVVVIVMGISTIQFSSRNHRSVLADHRVGPARVGYGKGRRVRTDAGRAVQISKLRGNFSNFLCRR